MEWAGIAAMLIVITVLLLAFVGPWILSLIDTGEQDGDVGTAFNIIWGDPDGTMAVRFQLDNHTEIDRARIRLQHYKSLDPGNPTSFSVTPRITADVTDSNAAGIVSFPSVEFDAIDGKRFYVENAIVATILSPGTYKFVVDVHVTSGMAHRVQWLRGTSNSGEAGSVFDGGYRDDAGSGTWTDDMQNPPWLWNLVVYGSITDDPSQPLTNETDTDETELVSTTTTTTEETQDATVLFAVGMLFLILGLIMIGVGLKVHVFIEIIGFIFFILAVLLLAWSSYIMLAMSIGLMMAKKDHIIRKEEVNS
jgi:hypothetical protein